MDQPLEEKVGATPKSTPLSCITITSSRSNSKQRSINKRGHNQGNFVKDICPPEIFPVFSLILHMTGKIHFQTGKVIILPIEFSRIPSNLNSNKRYYRR